MGNGEAETQAKASLRHYMKNLVKSRETRATSRTRTDGFQITTSRERRNEGVGKEIFDTWPDASIQIGPVMPFHLIGLGLADEEVSYIRGCKHHEIPCPFEEY
jgi:hypothetical protein